MDACVCLSWLWTSSCESCVCARDRGLQDTGDLIGCQDPAPQFGKLLDRKNVRWFTAEVNANALLYQKPVRA